MTRSKGLDNDRIDLYFEEQLVPTKVSWADRVDLFTKSVVDLFLRACDAAFTVVPSFHRLDFFV